MKFEIISKRSRPLELGSLHIVSHALGAARRFAGNRENQVRRAFAAMFRTSGTNGFV
jgi:hypothetical protein